MTVANKHCSQNISYRMEALLKSDNGALHITSTGDICVKKDTNLDKTMNQRYFYKIVASEKGSLEVSTNILLISAPPIDKLNILTKDIIVTLISINDTMPVARVMATIQNYPAYVYYGVIEYILKPSITTITRHLRLDSITGDLSLTNGFTQLRSKTVIEIIVKVNNMDTLSQVINVSLTPGGSKRFSKSLYEFHLTIDRTDINDEVVGQVTMEGLTLDDGPVSYYVKQTNYGEAIFVIDSITGVIKVKNIRLRQSTFSLNVFAKWKDDGLCDVQVLVLTDGVLSPPILDFTTVDVNIWENATLGSELVQIVSSTPSWTDHYSISYGRFSEWFSVHSKSGQVFLRQKLDREKTELAIITIELQNKWGSVKSNININILDNNDNEPICKDSIVDIWLNDSAPIGSVNCPIQCTDADTLDNGNLTYHLKIIFPNGVLSPIKIHLLTGCFEVSSTLDLWHLNPVGTYLYYVTVSDNGRDGAMSTTVKVNVKIHDTNNHRPLIKSYTVFHVEETAAFGTSLGKLLLDDGDLNSSVTLSIVDRHYSKWFYTETINIMEAVLRTRYIRGIRLGSHNVPLKLIDNASQPLTSYVNVTVIVHDSNDHDPVITFPAENQKIVFPCPLLSGSKIITVKAYDRDFGWNSRLNYFFKSNNTEEIFVLDKWSGAMTTKLLPSCLQSRRLQIIVTDMGQHSRSASVNIFISPERSEMDFSAMVTQNLSFNVPENALPGLILGTLRINSWNNLFGIKYLFFGLSTISPDSALHIDYDTHTLILLKNNAKTRSISYTITAICHKLIVPPRSFEFHLHLQSDKVQNSWPTFVEEGSIVRVKENQPPGTIVRQFSTKYSENDTIKFSLRQPADYFVIDSATGVMVTFVTLDREEMLYDTFSIEIIATAFDDTTKSSVLPIQVIVDDENDNAPLIISPVNTTIDVFVSESRNESIITVVAVDRDKCRNGQVNYSIDDDNFFTIDSRTGSIWLIRRPELLSHDVNVSVTDLGQPPFTSWRILTFCFQSSGKDNRIRFTTNIFSFNLSITNVPSNSILGTVTLTSLASYFNPAVRFQLLAGTFSQLLQIDSVTGVIKPSRPILISDTGRAEVLKLSVIAYATIDTSNYDIAKLLINIDHGNNHAPTFAKSNFIVKLPEGEAITDFLTVAANDPDLGIYGIISYQLKGDVDDQRISIDINTGRLSCSALHYHHKKNYNLEVIATDSMGGPISKHQSAFIQIYVLNSKQQPIEFNSSHFTINLKENMPGGTIMGSITVQSKPILSRVLYMLSPGHSLINLNSSNGVLITNGPVDHELTQFIDLTIVAISIHPHSHVVQSTRTTVSIRIIDENDNSPIPSQNPVIVRLAQPYDATSYLVKLSATDVDIGSNITFTFDLTDSMTRMVSSQYYIHPITGIIKHKFDYLPPDKDYHLLKVIVSDNGTPTQTTKVVVYVRIRLGDGLLNIKPDKPIFRLTENPSDGTFIGQINLNSNCPSGNTSFTIIDGVHKELVHLHPSSGKLFVSSAATIDREQISEIILWTQVQCLKTQLIGFKKVTIYIDDIDDNRPVFAQREYEAFVMEGQPPKTYVVRVIVFDPDQGINGQVEYFIEPHSPLDEFTIDIDGIVKTNIPLNFHTKSLYNLIIKATSKSTPLLFAECRVTVHIVNINDQRPMFASSTQHLQISEDEPVGSLLTTITATDSDGPDGISYRIRPRSLQNSSRFLSIAYDSGDVFLSRRIMASDRGRHELDIVADDGKYSSTTLLLVDIHDINNEYPILTEDGSDFIISESVMIGSTLLYLHSSDKDEGANADVKFDISPPVPWLGLRDDKNHTVAMYLISQPTFTSKVHFIGIQLTDRAINPKHRLSSVSTIALITESSNAHPPHFLTGNRSIWKIHESVPVGSKVASINCVDAEDRVTFGINSSSESYPLHIDSISGDVFITESLENHQLPTVIATITCRDSGQPQRKTTVMLTINIERKYKRLPQFMYNVDEIQLKTTHISRYPLLIRDLQNLKKDFWTKTRFSLISVVPNKSDARLKTLPEFHVDNLGNIWLNRSLESNNTWNLVLRIINFDASRTTVNELYQSSYLLITISISSSPIPDSDSCVTIEKLTAIIKENEFPSTTVLNLPVWYRDIQFTLFDNENFIMLCNEYSTSNCRIESRTALDFERNRGFILNLAVSGTTQAKQSCSHSLIIEVNVLDVDEYAPVFAQLDYSYQVPGGVPELGKVVYTIRATDNDKGQFGLIFYQLENNENGHLAIRNDSGEIYVRTAFQTVNDSLPRQKRSIDEKEQKSYHRETFIMKVIASSGERSSRVNVGLTILVPFIPKPNFDGRVISLTAIQISLIIVLPTSIVIVFIIVVVILWKRHFFHCKKRRPDNYSEGSRSYRSDSSKQYIGRPLSPDQHRLALYNIRQYDEMVLPDVTRVSDMTYPNNSGPLINSETQEFSINSDDNFPIRDNKNMSTLSHSSGTSSKRMDDFLPISCGSESIRNGPSCSRFCDSGLGHHQGICVCYTNNNNQRAYVRSNVNKVRSHESDLSGTSSSGYSVISHNNMKNPSVVQCSSTDRIPRSIEALRDGPVDPKMITYYTQLPSIARCSRSSGPLKNNRRDQASMPLRHMVPMMQHSNIDIRNNNNQQCTAPLMQLYCDSTDGQTFQLTGDGSYGEPDSNICKVVSINIPNSSAILSHPDDYNHEIYYAQTYSDITDIDS